MKSLEKFQYDSSPHTNEEVEELDESIVGMVRAGGEAVRNVLQKGKNLAKKVVSSVNKTPSTTQAAPVAKRRNVRSQEFRTGGKFDKEKYDAAGPNRQKDPVERKRDNLAKTINNQSKKVERVQQRTDKKVATAAKNLTKSVEDTRKQVAGQKFAKKRRDVELDRANKPSLMNRVKRFGYKDPNKAKKLIDGGLSSKLARNVGSVAKAVGQGIGKTPSTKVSYNQKGDGYSGAFGGLGDNVKEVGKNIAKAPTYSSTKINKKTGEVTKGAQVGTVGDKLGLSSLRNRNIDKPKKQKVSAGDVTGSAAKQREVTASDNADKSNQATSGGKSKGGQKSPTLSIPNKGRNITKTVTKTNNTKKDTSQSQNPDFIRRQQLGPYADDSNTSSTEVTPTGKEPEKKNLTYKSAGGQLQGGTTDITGTKKVDRFGKDQPYVTYNTGRRMVDANPNLKDQLSDTQVPANPRTSDEDQFRRKGKRNNKNNNKEEFTPKLFEQFLFEIDTKSTKKKKKDGRGMHPHDEIKPMSGTNTITINPEDETSKYKRGY
mgnify:CR=1 FL=1